jgi:trehalose/maltose hydrolase-like predicted phosphorylase
VTAWTYRLEDFVAGEEGRRESLCTLGNGYLATRGAMPESTADGVHYPGTYVAGTYNRLADVVDGHQIVNESMVNLPNWLVTALRIDGGAWLDLARDEVLEHWQQLDLREGIPAYGWLRPRGRGSFLRTRPAPCGTSSASAVGSATTSAWSCRRART